MKTIQLLIFFSLVYSVAQSQMSVIALQSNGVTSVYSEMSACVSAAVAGDTIYLPGGSIGIKTLVIDKRLTILGVGHHPDSSIATGRTTLQGTLKFTAGADNSFLSGIYLTGNLHFGTNASNHIVDNVTITRSNIGLLFLTHDGNVQSGASTLLTVDECIIRGDIRGNSKSLQIQKSITQGRNLNLTNSTFTNCILLHSNWLYKTIEACSGLVFKNCIHRGEGVYLANSSNVFFQNCIFEHNFTFPHDGSDASGCFVAKPLTEELVNQTGGEFSYNHDYHLKQTSVGINAGTDGTNIGIYGTTVPYKDGAVPFNPHFQVANIDKETDADGNLNVQIKVSTQER